MRSRSVARIDEKTARRVVECDRRARLHFSTRAGGSYRDKVDGSQTKISMGEGTPIMNGGL